MSKKVSFILLIILSFIGSVVTFYAANLAISDVSNMFGGVDVERVFTTIPALLVSIYFIIASIFVFRFCMYKDRKFSLLKTYSVIYFCIALLGIIITIVCFNLKSQKVNKYPFNGYGTILLVIHVFVLFLSLIFFIANCGKKDENITRSTSRLKNVIYSALLGGFIFCSYNKFGAFLCAFMYVQTRTLYLTFPFYVWLVIPHAILAVYSLYRYGYFDENIKRGYITCVVICSLNIIFAILTMVIGSQHTEFVSAISPALPLERLVTAPVGIIAHLIFSFAVGILLTYSTFKRKKAADV